MKETLSGFEEKGSWLDIVELSDRITEALQEVELNEYISNSEQQFEEWNEWRPHYYETIDEDISKKTAEQASVDEGEGERKGRSIDGDVKRAGEKIGKSYEKLDEEGANKAFEEWKESVNYVRRAADTASRRFIRRIERWVYRNLMTQVSPYYFDNELISANLSRVDDKRFRIEININDDELYNRIQEIVENQDWRASNSDVADVEVDTTTAEDAEGQNV